MISLFVVPAMAFSMSQTTGQVPQPWVEPGFGNIIWVDSPNFNERPAGTVVDTVVVHHTANDSLEETAKFFNTKESQVSAHYTIGKDGSIVQHVSTFKRAWHAGVSKDIEGRESVNHFSVGIEMVNVGDGKHPWPEVQTTALRFLIDALKRRFPLRYITSHKFIALPAGRKIDPIDYPWATLEGLGLKIVP